MRFYLKIENKTTICNSNAKVSNVFLFTFQIPQGLLMHLNAKFLSMLGQSNYIKWEKWSKADL